MINANDETQWAYLLDPTFELINTAGKPLTGGWINVYVAGTRNKYYCASDFNGTLHPFDIPLDSLGANIVLASPEFRYDVYVYNKYGTLVMSRYNVAPVLGGSVSVSGINDIVSDDGTVTINQYGDTFSLSIADTVSAVSGLDIRVHDIETSVTGIQEALSGKKDVQAPYSASGTNVQTITSVTQDANGVITVEYSDIQAQNPLTPGQYVTIDDDVISVTGLQPEGDYATEDYVDAAVSGIEPIDITSTDGSIVISSAVSGSVKVFDISVSGGQPVYFRGGDTWIPVNGTTADFSAVKKFDGTIVPSDIVSGTIPLEDGLWAWDAIVDIYVGGHVNELVKCGIKGQAVGGAYDPDSETELLIDSTRPGVINSFTLTGLSRGGPDTRLAFTFTRENTSTSTMWVRMRRLSVYQVKGPGVSQSGGGGDYEAGWGIIINGDVISVNSAIIPDIDTVSGMIQEAISGIPVSGYVTEQELAAVSGDIVNQIPDVSDYATHDEVNTVSGAIVDLIPEVSGFATHDEVNTVSGAIVAMIPEVEITPTLASGTKIAEYSVDGVSGEIYAPETIEVETVEVSAGSGISITDTGSGIVISCTVSGGGSEVEITPILASGTKIAEYSIDGVSGELFAPSGSSGGSDIFIATYGVTTINEIDEAFRAGKEIICSVSGSYSNMYSRLAWYVYNQGNPVRFIFSCTYPDSYNKDVESHEYKIDQTGWSNSYVYSTPISNGTIDAGKVLQVNADRTKSWVSISQVPSSTSADENKVLTVNSSGTPVWQTPQGGGSEVEITPALVSGTKIAEYSIDGVSGELFAPDSGETEVVVANNSPISGKGTMGEPLDLNIDPNTLTVVSVSESDLPIVDNFAMIYADTPLSQYVASNDITFTFTGITPTSSDRNVAFDFRTIGPGYKDCAPAIVSGGVIPAGASSFSITVNASNHEGWSDPYSTAYDWRIRISEDDGGSYPVISYTGCSHNGPAESTNVLAVKNPLPASTSADENKVLTVNSSGTPEWQPAQGGGSTYTAGDYISIENDEISVTGIDPDSYASRADLEAVSAAIPSGSYDLVAGQNITITASGTDLIISGQQGGTNVTITPDYNSGTRVARYSIDGVNGSIYTPTQVNANWNETSSSSKAYIQNKPTIHTYTGASGVAIDANDVVSLDSPVELVPGSNITIEVSGVSAVISSTGGGGGTTYTAGNMISLVNDAIAVSTTAGITDIQTVASLPANPVSTVLYLIPEA